MNKDQVKFPLENARSRVSETVGDFTRKSVDHESSSSYSFQSDQSSFIETDRAQLAHYVQSCTAPRAGLRYHLVDPALKFITAHLAICVTILFLLIVIAASAMPVQ